MKRTDSVQPAAVQTDWRSGHARSQYGVDPERIGAAGLSAGGHIVALLGVTDRMYVHPE